MKPNKLSICLGLIAFLFVGLNISQAETYSTIVYVPTITPGCSAPIESSKGTIGNIAVTYNGDTAEVTINTTSGWMLKNTYLYVGDSANIPTTKYGYKNYTNTYCHAYGDSTYTFKYYNPNERCVYVIPKIVVKKVYYRTFYWCGRQYTYPCYKYTIGKLDCQLNSNGANAIAAGREDPLSLELGNGTGETWGSGSYCQPRTYTYCLGVLKCCKRTTRTNPVPIQCTPDSVISYQPGLLKNGNPITDTSRLNPQKALGLPQDNDTPNFVSLGFGGSLTLFFANGVVVDVPGNDLRIVETSYDNPSCTRYPEKINMDISYDGISYYRAATNVCLDDSIDISGTGLIAFRFVRITDTTLSISRDGYDVDGIECLNQPADASGYLASLKTEITSPKNTIAEPIVPSNLEEYFAKDNTVINTTLSGAGISIYPNPAQQQLFVNANGEGQPITVILKNTMGATISVIQSQGIMDKVLDVSQLPDGLYFIMIEVGNKVEVKRIKIQH